MTVTVQSLPFASGWALCASCGSTSVWGLKLVFNVALRGDVENKWRRHACAGCHPNRDEAVKARVRQMLAEMEGSGTLATIVGDRLDAMLLEMHAWLAEAEEA